MRILAVVLLVIGLIAAISPQESKTQAVPQLGEPAVVRLHTLKGEFFCSGVVVNNKTILTAAHCVDDMQPKVDLLSVRNSAGASVGLAWVAGANQRADFAVLRGSFSNVMTQPHTVDPKVILKNIFNPKRHYITCGYPYGGSLFCMTIKGRGTYAFYISGTANLYPGMSGGPVIDVETGQVVAVNSAMYGQLALFAPIVEIYDALRIKAQ